MRQNLHPKSIVAPIARVGQAARKGTALAVPLARSPIFSMSCFVGLGHGGAEARPPATKPGHCTLSVSVKL
jgi:hypothetical protein